MARFQPGDIVEVDGIHMTVESWPSDDQGPFTATYALKGASVFYNGHAGHVRQEDEDGRSLDPAHHEDAVSLLAKGLGRQSTAGEIPGDDEDEPAASLTEDVEDDEPVEEAVADAKATNKK